MGNREKIIIEIDYITLEQRKAIEDMLATWQNIADNGKTQWTAFYVDGDNGFSPDIKVNGESPKYCKQFKRKELQHKIDVYYPPTKNNGLDRTLVIPEENVYMIDFTEIIPQ